LKDLLEYTSKETDLSFENLILEADATTDSTQEALQGAYWVVPVEFQLPTQILETMICRMTQN